MKGEASLDVPLLVNLSLQSLLCCNKDNRKFLQKKIVQMPFILHIKFNKFPKPTFVIGLRNLLDWMD